MSELPLIEVKNLSKTYSGNIALNNVSLNINAGKVIGLLGPNASGKTTFIKIMNGLLKDYSGELYINGSKPNHKTKAIVSYLPDTTYLSSWMKVKDAITFFKDMYFDFDEEKMTKILDRMRINPNQRVKAMSKGTHEKLQVALVMSRNARIYVLDEPIGGVDPAAREFILDIIRDYRHPDSTVILSTHLIYDIEDVFDEVIFLKDGYVELHEDAKALKERTGKTVNDLFKEVFRC